MLPEDPSLVAATILVPSPEIDTELQFRVPAEVRAPNDEPVLLDFLRVSLPVRAKTISEPLEDTADSLAFNPVAEKDEPPLVEIETAPVELLTQATTCPSAEVCTSLAQLADTELKVVPELVE